MVLDPHRLHDPGAADQFLELLPLVRPVQAGRDQHRDGVRSETCIEQLTDHDRQEQAVGHRPRDVADQDAGARSLPRQLGERRRVHRLCERLLDGGLRVRQHRHGRLAHDGHLQVVRKLDR
jgi:hypothetical protein